MSPLLCLPFHLAGQGSGHTFTATHHEASWHGERGRSDGVTMGRRRRQRGGRRSKDRTFATPPRTRTKDELPRPKKTKKDDRLALCTLHLQGHLALALALLFACQEQKRFPRVLTTQAPVPRIHHRRCSRTAQEHLHSPVLPDPDLCLCVSSPRAQRHVKWSLLPGGHVSAPHGMLLSVRCPAGAALFPPSVVRQQLQTAVYRVG